MYLQQIKNKKQMEKFSKNMKIKYEHNVDKQRDKYN